MKTTDLIPIILLELNESDKYGFELTKAIETKSNGKIVLKQPTLYTILKKLEKSKFISSYWQDSDIGGKRHYYKITDNGKSLVSTLPSYATLVNAVDTNNLEDEDANIFVDVSSKQPDVQNEIAEPEIDKKEPQLTEETQINILEQPKIEPIAEETHAEHTSFENYSIMDLLSSDNDANQSNSKNETIKEEIKESILPTQVVFEDNSLDTATSTETNLNNAQVLKEENTIVKENFASNENVTKFVETSTITDEYKSKMSATPTFENKESFDFKPVNNPNIEDVKFVEYQNYKANPNYIYAKKVVKNTLFKVVINSFYLLAMIILCSIIASFNKTSTLYYIFLILGIICLIFYPVITAIKLNNLKQNCSKIKRSDLKEYVIFAIIFMLTTLLICIIYNIIVGNNSIIKIFGFNNFANFYAPLLIGSVSCINILTHYIFMIKKLK